ncbi:AraC family transcriptional regulator [Yeosuana sp. MJ-SS3]|uniref:AraC family transcriptional regulator n=1 Tax=Gilvirhabdus luticola TaxID=3079858 RepID=A0ABU3U5B6_9FLAO|nr:AraC family transcriptional regulator [Yeosuana sp. MJ-SS3]MDU8885601.1 AraC family transcriptional regulator [Yeosuana sp. MJ-SS3]
MIVDLFEYFKKNPKYNKVAGDDYLIVEYKCPINSEEFQLWTETNMITYVISGKKDWIAPDKKYEITSGDALFIRKGVYTTKQYFEVDYCVMLFFITDDFIRNFIKELNPDSSLINNTEFPQIFEIAVNDSFQSLILSVFNYLKQGNEIPKELIEMKFKELLFNIVLNPQNHNLTKYFKSLEQVTKVNYEQIMHKNFQYDLKLEDFAKLCNTSLSTFKREFKNHFGDTPANWLKHKRLKYATSLLNNTSLQINEICYESGFKNASHFNKVFKQKYAITPNQFRLKST